MPPVVVNTNGVNVPCSTFNNNNYYNYNNNIIIAIVIIIIIIIIIIVINVVRLQLKGDLLIPCFSSME